MNYFFKMEDRKSIKKRMIDKNAKELGEEISEEYYLKKLPVFVKINN